MNNGTAPMNEQDKSIPIAVVGYACRFPDDATSPQGFYEMLAKGRSAWSEIPANRYNVDAYWHPNESRIGTTVSRGAHWMKEDPALFDAPVPVSMTSAEAASLDPQLRMLLEVVYECFENSGIPIQDVTGSDTSVFVGSSSSEYGSVQADDIENVPLYAAVGTGVSMLANRVSHFYDLQGASVALNTACSSGLVSVHLGCQSLRTGESHMSLVAASQLMLCPDGSVCLSRLGFLSPDSRCYTFDDRANGYARGEGICVMACKRLDDALADGDTIRAVIRGTLSNQDGRTPGIVQPNPKAQASLIRSVYEAAGIDPHTTQYFEAHGTGTRLGDPLEVSALVEAMGTKQRPDNSPLYIGSVKTNIGHLEGCAGLAGLLKTILSVERGEIFPSLNFDKPNPRLLLDDWNLAVPKTLTPWPVQGLRRASINSFGYGGSNAHCIIDDAYHYLEARGLKGNTTCCADPTLTVNSQTNGVNGTHINGHSASDNDSVVNGGGNYTNGTGVNGHSLAKHPQSRPQVFVMSSPEQAAVGRLAQLYADHLRDDPEQVDSCGDSLSLDSLAYTLSNRRSNFQWRTFFVANDIASLEKQMAEPSKAIRASNYRSNSLLFVFTGQGAQHFAMGRELLSEPTFAASINAADAFCSKTLHSDWSVMEELTKPDKDSRVNSARFSQPLCTILQVALVDLFRSWGVTPAAVTGHSSGEIAAAYAARALTAQDAWTIAYYRGLLTEDIPKFGSDQRAQMGMMAVGLSEQKMHESLDALPDAASSRVVVACCNAPQSVTLSGDRLALEDIEKELTAKGVFARLLKVDVAYHSPHMEVIAEKYAAALKNIRPQTDSQSGITMISSVTGLPAQNKDLDASYWVRNMCSPVRFTQALEYIFPLSKASVRRSKADKLSIHGIVEIGPHGALLGPIQQTLTQQGHKEDVFCSSVLTRGQDAYKTALEAVGNLWARGYSIEFSAVNRRQGSGPLKVLGNLPSYPWNHSTPFWLESTASMKRLRTSPRHDFIGAPTDARVEWKWRNFWRYKENPWLADYQVNGVSQISPTTLLCTIVEAARQINLARNKSSNGIELKNVQFMTALGIPENGAQVFTELQPTASPSSHRDSVTDFQFRIFTIVDDEPQPHCAGTLKLDRTVLPGSLETVRVANGDAFTKLSATDFYDAWAANGISWGPSFQLVQDIQRFEGGANVMLQLKDTKAAMPKQYEYEHLMHPTTLESVFQSIFAAMHDTSKLYQLRSIESLFIPTHMSKGPETSLAVKSQLDYQGFGSYIAGVSAVNEADPTQAVVAQGVQVECSTSDLDNMGSKRRAADLTKMASNLYWKPDVSKLSAENIETIFFDKDLVLTQPWQQTNGKAIREQSIPDQQRFTVPDLVPWKAYAAKWLELCSHKAPDQVILEVAGNTGDFTRKALDTLGGRDNGTPLCARYTCAIRGADARAQANESEWIPWKHFFALSNFDMFDTMRDGAPDPASVDLIVVTCHVEDSLSMDAVDALLRNSAAALKPAGRLILTQVGVGRRSKLIRGQLAQHGFSNSPTVIPHDLELSDGVSMVVASKLSSPVLAVSQAIIAVPEDMSSDLEDFVSSLCRRMQLEGIEAETALWTNMPTVIAGKAVICLVEADKPLIYDLDDDLLSKVMTFVGTDKNNLSKGGIWLTRGNCYLDGSGDPAYHASTGFIRVMRNEKQESKFTELSLSHKRPLDRQWAVDMVMTTFRDVFEAEALDTVAETEVGELDGLVYIPRIYDEPLKNRRMDLLGKLPPAETTTLLEKGKNRRLEIGRPDDLSSLRFVHVDDGRDALGADEVVVALRAHGVRSMNNIVTRLKLKEGQLGTDAAGTVVAVGSDVQRLAKGDEVALFSPGAYCTELRLSQELLMKIPASMTLEDASTLPSLLLAAHHIIFNICRLHEQDVIVVANAGTALSQVFIQVSQSANAKVIAVVADQDSKLALQTKCRHLEDGAIFTAADEAAVSSILAQTNGRGATFVLHDKSRDENMRTFAERCCSALGKVIEIQRDDCVPNVRSSRLHTCALADMERTFCKDKELCKGAMVASRHLFEEGHIQPLSPCAVFPYTDMQSAFQLASRRPSDRVALRLDSTDAVPVIPKSSSPLTCDPHGTILILGGLGGLGRWLCRKLAAHGARYIATFSRSGAASDDAKQCVSDLANMGITLNSYSCDVADPEAFQAAVDRVKAEMPPLRGAIHATMVLHEEYFIFMSPEQWHGSTRNKIQGGLNMHNMLPHDLDFFLLVSSISAIMGNGMQGSYSTGNAFLDGLALHRRSLGLPAKVVNFGVITGVGYVAERITLDSTHMSDYMLNSIDPDGVWDVIESALTGHLHLDEPMPTQLLTCAGSGGLTQKLKHIKTLGHTADPKYRYIVRLDAFGSDDSFTTIRKGRKELADRLGAASSFAEALNTVEAAMIDKIASAIPMPSSDVDAARPPSAYGIDSLIANEIRNWAFTIVKGALTTADVLSAPSIAQLAEKLTSQSSLVGDSLKSAAES